MTRAGPVIAVLLLVWLAVYAHLAEHKLEPALAFWTGGVILAVADAAQ